MKNLDNIVVVIGSMALKYHIDIEREPVDCDYIMTYDTFEGYIKDCKKFDQAPPRYYPISNGKKYVCMRVGRDGSKRIDEIEIAWPGSTAEELMVLLLDDDSTDIINLNPYGNQSHAKEFWFPSLDVLYTIKMTHRFLKNSPHFEKTRNDILKMRAHGAKLVYEEWFKRREKETYDYKHPNLNQKANEFFQNEEFYLMNHDSIHEAIKLYDKPAYTYILEDGEEVKCSKKKWDLLSHELKMAAAVEENFTLLIERTDIGRNIPIDLHKMVPYCVMKTATSITSGYFRDFIYNNYVEIVSRIFENIQSNHNFIEKFKTAVNNGKILKFKSSEIYHF